MRVLLQLKPKVPLEVMVYIHGGGFFSGTGASYAWGPQYLLDKDVVLVTFNYRVGALGKLQAYQLNSHHLAMPTDLPLKFFYQNF
jgi:carboxylesterase type B